MSRTRHLVFLQDCEKDPRIGLPREELVFHAERKWRFDFAWPDKRVALEVEGGVFGFRDPKTGKMRKGAHGSISGIKRDIEKYNYAAAMGWLVIRCLPSNLLDPETREFLAAAMSNPRTPRK